MSTDEEVYHATPQIRGSIAHHATDTKTASTRRDDIQALAVYSERFHLMGKIDIYKRSQKKLIERKYQLRKVFRGQIYQLWAQYFCLREMGYEIEELAFYEISTKRMHPIPLPTPDDETAFEAFIQQFLRYDPSHEIDVNPNKCRHCIYCNLCDKTDTDNVYT